ncbi:hypothetical protein EJB05_24288, partial [Eragrostis curvula]
EILLTPTADSLLPSSPSRLRKSPSSTPRSKQPGRKRRTSANPPPALADKDAASHQIPPRPHQTPCKLRAHSNRIGDGRQRRDQGHKHLTSLTSQINMTKHETKSSLSSHMSISKAIGVVSGINEFGNLFQLVKSTISYLRSQWNGMQEQEVKEHEVLQLKSDLRGLSETLPAMYNLIDRAEWRSQEKCVAELLPKLKDAMYDAEDLLDEFSSYELKVSIEGNATQLSPLIEFFHSVTRGSFNKVNDIQNRLSNISNQLEKMGLHEATPRFDKCIRPVTTSFRTEPKIFGRENEIEEVVRLLGVPNYSNMSSSKRKRTSNAANNEPRASFLPVLPIVGIGGVGKTTLAQEITTLQSVKSHFDKIIWICVSDDFDAVKFTKVLINSLSGKEATTDNFDALQQDLVAQVGENRFLLILDDIWPDALTEDGLCWRKFCAPLRNGSMLLVTTRFAEVSDTVGTMESFALEGLKPEVFWDFFKLCVFGFEDSHIDPQLELIGRSILPKLKGSPLAAKTIGRLLRKNLNTEHWNHILNSELWQIRQNGTDILPALRLSYMYLPFHLKRCFSFCAVYPKDYSFQKASLAEIWMAEGFIEPQGNIPLQHIGDQYFEDLVSLSFFQKLRGTYVIHDLMHDMAQLVSKDECFIINNTSDYGRVPQNVRHLSILKSSDVNLSNLSRLCHHTKLRTLLCNKSLRGKTSVIDRWFSELLHLRVVSCAYMKEPPESIGNLKNLRYLEISTACRMSSRTIPSSFCCLYNLQILYARNCLFENLPVNGLSKMINLQKFEAHVPLQIQAKEVNAVDWGKGIYSIRNTNQITRDVTICNIGAISKDHAVEMNLRTKDYLNSLTLIWSSSTAPEHNEIEVIEALHPPNSLKSVQLKDYPGEYIPSWFQSFNCLEGLKVSDCPNIKSQKLFSLSLNTLDLVNSGNLGDNIECCSLTYLHLSSSNLMSIQTGMWSLPVLQELVIVGCDSLTFIGGRVASIFPSLTELIIDGCKYLSSLEQFIQPDRVPAIKRIRVTSCQELRLLHGERFESFPFLRDLEIRICPRLYWQSGIVLPASLRSLTLSPEEVAYTSAILRVDSSHFAMRTNPTAGKAPAIGTREQRAERFFNLPPRYPQDRRWGWERL